MHSQTRRRLLANALIITANQTFFSSKAQNEYLGFKNLGNTCYMYFYKKKKCSNIFLNFRNSVLQSLINLQNFHEIFSNLNENTKKTDFILALENIINLKSQKKIVPSTYFTTISRSLGT